jgi:hypothetical protein
MIFTEVLVGVDVVHLLAEILFTVLDSVKQLIIKAEYMRSGKHGDVAVHIFRKLCHMCGDSLQFLLCAVMAT